MRFLYSVFKGENIMRRCSKSAVQSPVLEVVKHTAIGVAAGLICSIVLSLLAALVLTLGSLPHRSIAPISMAIIAVSMLIGSFIAGKMLHRKGLLLGALVGVAAFAVVFLCGMLIPDENIGVTVPIKALLCVIPSIVGAVMGVNTRARR